ncbi:MAG TPA: hypothetical protein VFE32_04280 [Puia sp.]|jgi:hypothetical protein|nr:hypothetical protein [Puia sp.]
MRKFKFHLLLFALLGAGAAYTNKPDKPAPNKVTNKVTYHTYAFAFYNMNFTKIYYLMDLTEEGMVIGIDYDCQQPISVCTFIADITREHTDGTGNWFYVSDIPQSGINYGTFIDFDD